MCGIVGVFNVNQETVHRSMLKSMVSKLAHRGPDGQGFFVNNNIGLAHKRLAILDTSDKGTQPMSSKNNKWTIVFNGCIYNFSELKQKLKSIEHTFISEMLNEGKIMSERAKASGLTIT